MLQNYYLQFITSLMNNANRYYLSVFQMKKNFYENWILILNLHLSKAYVIRKASFTKSWKRKWYFLATKRILRYSYIAIIKSLIRFNNDAKEIFKQTRKGRAEMLRRYLLYISRSIVPCNIAYCIIPRITRYDRF